MLQPPHIDTALTDIDYPSSFLKRACMGRDGSWTLASPREWAAATPLQAVDYEPLAKRGIRLSIKREDSLHESLSGNKLYKLHGHVMAAQQQGAKTLISFGGYYSNHLHALAFLGARLGYQTVGLVRGHRPKSLSPTLIDCERQGMQLVFLGRKQYLSAQQPAEHPEIAGRYRSGYVIAAGGDHPLGAKGCGAIMESIRAQMALDNATVCVPCGTGTTLAGMIDCSRPGESLLGVSALKLGDQLAQYQAEVGHRLTAGVSVGSWRLVDEQWFGGFAKVTPGLLEFMRGFEAQTQVLLDPIYTAKMMHAITSLAEQGYWKSGHHVVAIHTGGLQGRRGIAGLSKNN